MYWHAPLTQLGVAFAREQVTQLVPHCVTELSGAQVLAPQAWKPLRQRWLQLVPLQVRSLLVGPFGQGEQLSPHESTELLSLHVPSGHACRVESQSIVHSPVEQRPWPPVGEGQTRLHMLQCAASVMVLTQL